MEYEATISELIISHLLSARSSYRQKKILWELVRKRMKSSKQNYYQAVYRLSKKGFIKEKDQGYILSDTGKSEYANLYRPIKKKIKKTKKILVIFDIPESKRKIRGWIRSQLRWWNFKMMQKSVWLGDGPLPVEFKERLKDLGVRKSVLIFTVKSEKQGSI